jgi:hypothetical protein
MLRVEQVPACGLELAWLDPAAFINPLKRPGGAVLQGVAPGKVAVASDDAVSHPMFERLLRVKSCVYAAEDHSCSSFAGQATDTISSERVTGMDSDSHHVPRFNCGRV